MTLDERIERLRELCGLFPVSYREVFDEALPIIAELREIIARNDLCHNQHGKVDARSFADGCAAEQRNLYGCAHDADELAELRAELATWHDIHGTEKASEVADALNRVRQQRDEARAERDRLQTMYSKAADGKLWAFLKDVMSQGASIQQDYAAGTHETYEHYARRMDIAASERLTELRALFGPKGGQ